MPYRSKHCIKVWRSRVLGIPNAFQKKTKREKEKHFAKALYHSTPLHVLHYKVFLNSFRNTTI